MLIYPTLWAQSGDWKQTIFLMLASIKARNSPGEYCINYPYLCWFCRNVCPHLRHDSYQCHLFNIWTFTTHVWTSNNHQHVFFLLQNFKSLTKKHKQKVDTLLYSLCEGLKMSETMTIRLKVMFELHPNIITRQQIQLKHRGQSVRVSLYKNLCSHLATQYCMENSNTSHKKQCNENPCQKHTTLKWQHSSVTNSNT